ncbi:MAG TPA: phosphoribosyltransferase family protein, partial [Candidatus Dormibacteraeota bacterium]|nr:phosphoribosyltransferase family protein [Candidatus Dormibacteraeota bacterium]
MIGAPLYDSRSIADRVSAIGAAISQDYAGKLPLMIGMLTAAVTFLADLARAVTIPCQLDFISVNKYGDGDGIVLEKDVA